MRKDSFYKRDKREFFYKRNRRDLLEKEQETFIKGTQDPYLKRGLLIKFEFLSAFFRQELEKIPR